MERNDLPGFLLKNSELTELNIMMSEGKEMICLGELTELNISTEE